MYMPDCNSASGMNGKIAIGIGDFKRNICSVHAETSEDHSFLYGCDQNGFTVEIFLYDLLYTPASEPLNRHAHNC